MAKKKSFLPKKIGGVKVPKAVRRGRLGELLASRTGQALIAEAVMGAGAVVAAKKAKDSPKARRLVQEAADRLQRAGGEGAQEVGAAGSALAYALGEAARSFAEALHRGQDGRSGIPRAGGDTAWTPDYAAPEAGADGKKKQTPQASFEAGPP